MAHMDSGRGRCRNALRRNLASVLRKPSRFYGNRRRFYGNRRRFTETDIGLRKPASVSVGAARPRKAGPRGSRVSCQRARARSRAPSAGRLGAPKPGLGRGSAPLGAARPTETGVGFTETDVGFLRRRAAGELGRLERGSDPGRGPSAEAARRRPALLYGHSRVFVSLHHVL